MDAALGAVRRATQTLPIDVAVGYVRERPDYPAWRNFFRRARAGIAAELPFGFTLDGNAELGRTGAAGGHGRGVPSVFNRAFGVSIRSSCRRTRFGNARHCDRVRLVHGL